MSARPSPAILIAYPSCFYYPAWMERVEIKTSQLLLASYLARFFPIAYADFEITIGRANTAAQVRRYERKVREFLQEQDFDVLALSCWTSLSYQATLTTARICRELYPDKLIVVGGYHPTAKPTEFASADGLVDYVICGEGEIALQQIVEKYARDGRPDNPQIVNSRDRGRIEMMRYDWSIVDSFARRHFPDGLSSVYLYLSRGCPFHCSFCMEPLKDQSWRALSPQEAVQEVFIAAERFRTNVGISDACFGLRPAWRREFLQRLVDARPPFWVVMETRAEYLDEEDVKLLAQLKTEIQFGLESGSPAILSLMRKTRQPQKYLDRFRHMSHLLSDHGVIHRANLIFNHPGETKQTVAETFAFIDQELKRHDSYLIWAWHGYMHFPGCELDVNRKYYEEKFGSRFLSPAWWHEPEDQYDNSMKFIPSRDLDGDDVDLWGRMATERENDLKAALAPEAFRFAARKYFLHWKNDPRYQQN